MERVALGNLPSSSRVTWFARMRTNSAPEPDDSTLYKVGLKAPVGSQVRTVLISVFSLLSPPQNVKSVLRSDGHFHMDRSFSTWK